MNRNPRLAGGHLAALLRRPVCRCAHRRCRAPKLEVALTFDDLPRNGGIAPGVTRVGLRTRHRRVLKKHRIPPSYGFINANKLERNPDGARALQIWIEAGNPLANHTYSHLDITKNSVEDFQKEILRNEPALELLTPGANDWRWFRYPYLHEGDTLEKRRAVRAFLASAAIASHRPRSTGKTISGTAHMRAVWRRTTRRPSTGCAAVISPRRERWMRVQRDFSRQVWGRDIHHVALLHLGSFSSHILPDLFKLLEREGYRDRDARGGAERSDLRRRPGHGGATRRHAHRAHDAGEGNLLAARLRRQQAARETPQHLQLKGDRFIFASTGLTSGLSHVRENKPVPN